MPRSFATAQFKLQVLQLASYILKLQLYLTL